ncbi:MAG: MFS transporter [Armatimonadota bacterium]
MLPLELFSSRHFAIGNLIGLFYNFGLYGTLFVFSFFFQDIRKFPAVLTGLAFLPMTVTGALTSPLISGRITSKYGLWPTLTIGLSSAVAGSTLLSSVGLHSDYRLIATGLLLFGFGTGMMAPAMTAAVLIGTPEKQSGIASAVLNASRQVGGVLGVAAFGAMLNGHRFIPMMHVASRVVAGLFLIGIVLTLTFLRTSISPALKE